MRECPCVKLKRDVPVFTTAPQEATLTRTEKIDTYETTRMANRITYLRLKHTFTDDQRIEAQECGHCGARVYLEGLPDAVAAAPAPAAGHAPGGAPASTLAPAPPVAAASPWPAPVVPGAPTPWLAPVVPGAPAPWLAPVVPAAPAPGQSALADGAAAALAVTTAQSALPGGPSSSGAGGGGASTAQPLPTDGTPAKKPRLAINVVQALMDAKSLKEAGCIDSPTFADLKARLLHGE